MRQIEHRLRNIEAKAMANAPQERTKLTRRMIGLNAKGYWSVVSEIDEDGNETPLPPEKQVRLEGTSDTTAAEQFKIRNGKYPKWHDAQGESDPTAS